MSGTDVCEIPDIVFGYKNSQFSRTGGNKRCMNFHKAIILSIVTLSKGKYIQIINNVD